MNELLLVDDEPNLLRLPDDALTERQVADRLRTRAGSPSPSETLLGTLQAAATELASMSWTADGGILLV